MPVRHAMLVITRAVFDMVEIPGQEPLVVAKDSGDEAARRWWDERVRAVAADVFGRNSENWERQLADWQAGTDVAVGKERLHDGGPRVDVARIRFPDGTETVVDPQNAHDYVAEEFRARKPQPTVAAQFAEWRETVQIAELHTWVGWLFNGADHVPVNIGLPGVPVRLPDQGGPGLPRPAVPGRLADRARLRGPGRVPGRPGRVPGSRPG